MKTILIPALVLLSLPTFAAKIKNANCSDVTSINENVQPQYLAVIDGYDKTGKKVSEEIDMSGIVADSKNINAQCAKDKTTKIDSLRSDLKTNTASSTAINPTKAKCKDFVELGTEVQPVAVFWVAGHEGGGKLKKGEVDEEFLTQPIATLVEDCRTHPTASFYDRTKAWLKKRL